MPNYKLKYLNVTGRGEVSRILFAWAGIPYEDVRCEILEREPFKQASPFGVLPILEWDDKILCQSHAIESYLAKQFGLAGKDDYEEARCAMVAMCAEEYIVDSIYSIYMCITTEGNDLPQANERAKTKFINERIPFYMNKLEKLLCSNGDGVYFVGDGMTYADVAVFHMITYVPRTLNVDVEMARWPKLDALIKAVSAEPRIKKWLETRPKTPF